MPTVKPLSCREFVISGTGIFRHPPERHAVENTRNNEQLQLLDLGIRGGEPGLRRVEFGRLPVEHGGEVAYHLLQQRGVGQAGAGTAPESTHPGKTQPIRTLTTPAVGVGKSQSSALQRCSLSPHSVPARFSLGDGGARAMSNGQSGHSQQAQAAKQQSASERMEFAAERTVLANERTYAAWMWTGLAAFVSGLAALRFMKEVLANWALLAVALALLAFAAFSFAVGAWRYVHMGRSLAESKIAQVQSWLVLGTTVLLLAAALIAIGSTLLLW